MTKSNTQPTAGHRIRVLFAVLLALVVAGCTTIRFTYNNGDTLLYWWINAYVDLEGEQSDVVKKDIDKVFAWHRQTQLHDYAALLQKAKQQLNGPVTPQALHGLMDDVKARGQRLALHAAPQLADLARSLQPDQIGNLEEKFAKNNRDYRRKFMSGDPEQRKKIRYKKTMEQLKIWFGSFSNEQEDAIRRLSDARPLDNEVWLQERMRRQRTIVDLVKRVQSQRLDKPATVALIENTIRETFNRLDTPERKANYDAQLKFYSDIIRLTTPEQKAHAQQRMQGWIEDMNTLAREKQT
ncbi:MAG TPA: DUF6279 family lipoprotein [Telluria sp.]|nr:DUF6279 family lipoprotein [Telluria sp.]